MTKVTLPKIPKGNLGKIYVLSERAADAFFKESLAIVKECWPLSEKYIVPSSEQAIITLQSSFRLWLPTIYNHPIIRAGNNVIGIGSLGIEITYNEKYKNGSTRGHQCSRGILEFLCETEKEDNYKDSRLRSTYPVCVALAPNTHIFIYAMVKLSEINLLPSDLIENGFVDKKTEDDLNSQIEPAFEEITDRIKKAMEERSAVLTRGWLSNQFVL